MKVVVDQSEWWPVYLADSDIGGDDVEAVEVPDELMVQYATVMEAFDVMQDKLRAIYWEVQERIRLARAEEKP